jgi:NADPH2:quinone reductase
MRGVGVFEFGAPDVLQLIDLPEVHAGPGEIRVRVHAASVNPTDLSIRNGARAETLRDIAPPYVPGMDAAGVIDEIGLQTETNLTVGTSVMAMVVPLGNHGAYRESVVLSADSVSRAPESFSHPEVSTLPMNGLTARLSLDQLALHPGQTIAVTGSAGAYGGYIIQIAKNEGLRVIADASSSDESLVTALGADVIVPRGDDFSQQVRKVVPEGVDGLADGAVLTQLAVGAVRDGGAFASVRGWAGTGERNITFHRTSVRDYNHRNDLLDQLRQLVETRVVTLRVAGTYEPSHANQAHRRLEARGTRGRCVIVFE